MTKNPSAHAASSSHDGDESKYNIFRDSLLRYCGYANEVGESFRYQYPKFVVPSYGIAFGYCLADSVSSGYQVVMSEECDVRDDESPSISKEKRAGIAMLDTLLWQSLASVVIPGGVINTIVKASRFVVSRAVGLPLIVAKWVPTAAGLGSIPFIIQPIDHCVDYALDNSIRKMLII